MISALFTLLPSFLPCAFLYVGFVAASSKIKHAINSEYELSAANVQRQIEISPFFFIICLLHYYLHAAAIRKLIRKRVWMSLNGGTHNANNASSATPPSSATALAANAAWMFLQATDSEATDTAATSVVLHRPPSVAYSLEEQHPTSSSTIAITRALRRESASGGVSLIRRWVLVPHCIAKRWR